MPGLVPECFIVTPEQCNTRLPTTTLDHAWPQWAVSCNKRSPRPRSLGPGRACRPYLQYDAICDWAERSEILSRDTIPPAAVMPLHPRTTHNGVRHKTLPTDIPNNRAAGHHRRMHSRGTAQCSASASARAWCRSTPGRKAEDTLNSEPLLVCCAPLAGLAVLACRQRRRVPLRPLSPRL